MIAIAARTSGYKGELDLPKTSELLKIWALPMMGSALAEDEKEREAIELFKSVERLAKKAAKTT